MIKLGIETAVAAAACACVPWIGKGDKVSADQAAVKAMREVLNTIPMDGRIVIGEGERDKAPMLHIGELVGTGGPKIDIAVDPLEGTELCARGQPGAICVLSYAPRGELLHAPDIYMDKIAAGPGILLNPSDIDEPLELIIDRIERARGRSARVVILDRNRHESLIQVVNRTGAELTLISDGDVMASLQTAIDFAEIEPEFDLYIGTGGAPEGVLAASGLQHLGGSFIGRLNATSKAQKSRAEKLELKNLEKIYETSDLASANTTLVIAGVTRHILRQASVDEADILIISEKGMERKTLSTTFS
ncbi:MAG: fructose-bisphosphatase class II family protein [Alphaproteobacteria bacterium]